MVKTAGALLLSLGLGVGTVSVCRAEDGLPNPLRLQQAMAFADDHPRNRAESGPQGDYPRARPFYLNCQQLAYDDIDRRESRRIQRFETLVAPTEAQRLEILLRFFDVLLADIAYARYNEAMAVAYVQWDRARARQELGQFSDLRVAELEAAYYDIRRRRAAAEAAMRLTRSLLAQAIDRPSTLPADLVAPTLPPQPNPFPAVEQMMATALNANRWLATRRDAAGRTQRQLMDMALRQEMLELSLRLEVLEEVERYADSESARREIALERARTLYEQEFASDLGFAMSQQTRARLRERRVAYCKALTLAELNALQGRSMWPEKAAE